MTTPRFEIEASGGWATGALFLPNGTLLTTGVDNLIKQWQTDPVEFVGVFKAHAKSVDALALSPDGSALLSGSVDTTARVWDVASREPLTMLAGHTKTVAAVAWVDEAMVATGSYDTTVRLWDPASGEEIARLRGHAKNVVTLAVSPDRSVLVSAGVADDVRMWTLPDGNPIAIFPAHEAAVAAARFSGPHTLVTVGADDTLKVWDAESREPLGVLELPATRVYSMAVSHDGSLAAVTADRVALLVSLDATPQVVGQIDLDVKGVYGAAFSADDTMLAVASSDSMVRGWKVRELVGN